MQHASTSDQQHGQPVRPDRPCDACRRRKSRCVIDPKQPESCIMCSFHNQNCTFLEEATSRRRKARSPSPEQEVVANQRKRTKLASVSVQQPEQVPRQSVSASPMLDDYANLQGASLLKKTLGLQNHRYASYLGSTGIHDTSILNLRSYDNLRAESTSDNGAYRKVEAGTFFLQSGDAEHADHPQDLETADQIEALVSPHGEALIKLYFRIVHPSYPVLHKKVYLEKYSRTHREFSPPLLAAVYILALNWWSYSSELAKQTKPDVARLEHLALSSLHRIARRAKLSTVQAAILLSQRPSLASWQLTCLTVGIAQDLGLHLDCSRWRVPPWERGLRKRLAWAVFMQDTWSALVYGRPPHLNSANWAVQTVTGDDFPESAADEDAEDGSTEVEKGRTLFSAMITVSLMLAGILRDLCSVKALAEIDDAVDPLKAVLAQAKPIQLKLRAWYADVPEALKVDAPSRIGKLNSVGSLQLAYLAAEMTIHRRIISVLTGSTARAHVTQGRSRRPSAQDPYLISVCRSAARTRLINALDFVSRLKSEHLQSFWYFGSAFDFALIGSFAGLCLATAMTQEEAEFYKTRLLEYRWQLRVWSSGIEVLQDACDTLTTAVQPLLVSSLTSPPAGSGIGNITHIDHAEDIEDDLDLYEQLSAAAQSSPDEQFINQIMHDSSYGYMTHEVLT